MSLKKTISMVTLAAFCFANLGGLAVSLNAADEILPVDKSTIKGDDKSKIDVGEKEDAVRTESDQEKADVTPDLKTKKKEPKAKEQELKNPDDIKRGRGDRTVTSQRWKGIGGLLLLIILIAAVAN